MYKVIEEDVKYVIVTKCAGSDKRKYEFVSELAHEFKGMKQVIGYADLERALHFDTLEDAKRTLASQPEWVKGFHDIIPFERRSWGECYTILGATRYSV